MSIPSFHYFDARNIAEVCRILMHLGGMEFQDVRYPFVCKPDAGLDAPEFHAAIENGELTGNMDRLPVLEIDGIRIGQSRSIERFISNKCHLMGKTEIERGLIDCITENIRDIRDKWNKIKWMPEGEEKTKLIQNWFHEGGYAQWLVKLEKSLPKSLGDEDYAVGDQISLADVTIWHLLSEFYGTYTEEAKAAEIKASCVRLTSIAKKVACLEKMKHYLASRPAAPF